MQKKIKISSLAMFFLLGIVTTFLLINWNPHLRPFMYQHNYKLFREVNWVNKNIEDGFLVVPFFEVDFQEYTKHRVFINRATPIYKPLRHYPLNHPYYDFQEIFENDLHCSLEELFGLPNFDKENYSKKWQELWENLDEETIKKWQEKYHVTHVIRERELPLNFPVLHQNEFYIVYEIR